MGEIAVALIGGVFLLLGKRVEEGVKRREEVKKKENEAKAVERREELAFRQTNELKYTKLFEAFIEERQNAAVAFEGIHQSITRIGDELKDMKEENREYRVSVFNRIEDLEKKTSLHDGLLRNHHEES